MSNSNSAVHTTAAYAELLREYVRKWMRDTVADLQKPTAVRKHIELPDVLRWIVLLQQMSDRPEEMNTFQPLLPRTPSNAEIKAAREAFVVARQKVNEAAAKMGQDRAMSSPAGNEWKRANFKH